MANKSKFYQRDKSCFKFRHSGVTQYFPILKKLAISLRGSWSHRTVLPSVSLWWRGERDPPSTETWWWKLFSIIPPLVVFMFINSVLMRQLPGFSQCLVLGNRKHNKNTCRQNRQRVLNCVSQSPAIRNQLQRTEKDERKFSFFPSLHRFSRQKWLPSFHDCGLLLFLLLYLESCRGKPWPNPIHMIWEPPLIMHTHIDTKVS